MTPSWYYPIMTTQSCIYSAELYLCYTNTVTRHCPPSALSVALTHAANAAHPARVAFPSACQWLSKQTYPVDFPWCFRFLKYQYLPVYCEGNQFAQTEPTQGRVLKIQQWMWSYNVLEPKARDSSVSQHRHSQRCRKSIQICQERKELYSWTPVNPGNHIS